MRERRKKFLFLLDVFVREGHINIPPSARRFLAPAIPPPQRPRMASQVRSLRRGSHMGVPASKLAQAIPENQIAYLLLLYASEEAPQAYLIRTISSDWRQSPCVTSTLIPTTASFSLFYSSPLQFLRTFKSPVFISP